MNIFNLKNLFGGSSKPYSVTPKEEIASNDEVLDKEDIEPFIDKDRPASGTSVKQIFVKERTRSESPTKRKRSIDTRFEPSVISWLDDLSPIPSKEKAKSSENINVDEFTKLDKLDSQRYDKMTSMINEKKNTQEENIIEHISAESALDRISIIRYERNDSESFRKKYGYIRSSNGSQTPLPKQEASYTQYKKNIRDSMSPKSRNSNKKSIFSKRESVSPEPTKKSNVSNKNKMQRSKSIESISYVPMDKTNNVNKNKNELLVKDTIAVSSNQTDHIKDLSTNSKQKPVHDEFKLVVDEAKEAKSNEMSNSDPESLISSEMNHQKNERFGSARVATLSVTSEMPRERAKSADQIQSKVIIVNEMNGLSHVATKNNMLPITGQIHKITENNVRSGSGRYVQTNVLTPLSSEFSDESFLSDKKSNSTLLMKNEKIEYPDIAILTDISSIPKHDSIKNETDDTATKSSKESDDIVTKSSKVSTTDSSISIKDSSSSNEQTKKNENIQSTPQEVENNNEKTELVYQRKSNSIAPISNESSMSLNSILRDQSLRFGSSRIAKLNAISPMPREQLKSEVTFEFTNLQGLVKENTVVLTSEDINSKQSKYELDTSMDVLNRMSILDYEKNDTEAFRKKYGYIRSLTPKQTESTKYTQYKKKIKETTISRSSSNKDAKLAEIYKLKSNAVLPISISNYEPEDSESRLTRNDSFTNLNGIIPKRARSESRTSDSDNLNEQYRSTPDARFNAVMPNRKNKYDYEDDSESKMALISKETNFVDLFTLKSFLEDSEKIRSGGVERSKSWSSLAKRKFTKFTENLEKSNISSSERFKRKHEYLEKSFDITRNTNDMSALNEISIFKYEKNDFEKFRKRYGYLRSLAEFSTTIVRQDAKYRQYKKKIRDGSSRLKTTDTIVAKSVKRWRSNLMSSRVLSSGVKAFKDLNSLRNLPPRILISIIIAILGLCTGIAGMVCLMMFGIIGGLVYLNNQFIAFWLASCLSLFSIQAIYSSFKDSLNSKSNKLFAIDLAYFIICGLLATGISICYSLGQKLDASLWATAVQIISLLNVFILWLRRSNARTSVTPTLVADERIRMMYSHKRLIKIFKILNTILKILLFVLLCALLYGSIINGAYQLKYPQRGYIKRFRLAEQNRRNMHINLLCAGNRTTPTTPIFMIEGGSNYTLLDLLGIQRLLTANNRRSCIWDKPGYGYSDNLYVDMNNTDVYYHRFITAIRQTIPYIFVGIGDGADIIYKYAARFPWIVNSMVFIDAKAPQDDWVIQKQLNNWNDSVFDSFASKQIYSLYSQYYMYSMLFVPFGLMSYVVNYSSLLYTDLTEERNWYHYGDKEWITKMYTINSYKNPENVYAKYNISSSIKVYNIMSFKSDEQIERLVCAPLKLAPMSDECIYQKNANRLSISHRSNLIYYNKIIKCTNDLCNLDYLVNYPNFTVNALLSLFP